ncbi:MAG: replication initiation protein, partial [Sneathiellaceae bacterium]
IVKVQVTREGETTIERVQLLGGNIEHQAPDGLLHYEIPPRLRRIIKDSTIFARLQKQVMFALTSKYALCLYEMVQKRGNLSYKTSEDFSLAALRAVLGVPKGKLTTWSNLHNRAIAKAVQEVNELSDYIVQVEPLKRGRRVAGVRLRWWRKDADGLQAAARELQRPKVGRAARLQGRVEAVQPPPGALPPPKPKPRAPDGPAPLRSVTYETARLRYPGYDIYVVEQEWRGWSMDHEPPRNPDQAFLAFFRRFAEENPLW